MRFLQVLPKKKWQKFCAECARKRKIHVINRGWCKRATPLIVVFERSERNVLIKKQKKIKKYLQKVKSSDKIAKSPEATEKNKKVQSVISLMGAAEYKKVFKKIKKVVDKKRQDMLI